jgi:hypothetical protein
MRRIGAFLGSISIIETFRYDGLKYRGFAPLSRQRHQFAKSKRFV